MHDTLSSSSSAAQFKMKRHMCSMPGSQLPCTLIILPKPSSVCNYQPSMDTESWFPLKVSSVSFQQCSQIPQHVGFSKRGPIRRILHLVSCAIPIWCHLYASGIWASCEEPLRPLSPSYLMFSSRGSRPAANSHLASTLGQSVLSWPTHVESHIALKMGQHSACDSQRW